METDAPMTIGKTSEDQQKTEPEEESRGPSVLIVILFSLLIFGLIAAMQALDNYADSQVPVRTAPADAAEK